MREDKVLNIGKDIKNYTGIDNVKPILEYFNNPQDKLKIIHVAGTNGKGSICNFINNILIENNYKVGLFSSPTIFKPNERFKINNIDISDFDLKKYYNRIENVAKDLNIELHEFDKATVLAFLYFYDLKCDFGVIEVGIGGRIDSTNIIKSPLISVIGNIGMDHLNILGDNIEDITKEKAGIIKENSLAILYNQDKKIMDILVEKSKEVKSSYIVVEFDNINILERSLERIIYKYEDKVVELKMINEIQVNNSAIALEVALQLEKMGYRLNNDNIMRGILNTKMLGRFQKLNDDPLVILDGAHNVDSVKALSKTLREEFKNEDFVFIMGFYKDKEYLKLVDIVAPLAYAFLPCQLDDERFVSSEELTNIVGMFCDRTYNGRTVENSLDIALKHFKDKKIIIFGSLSLIESSINYFK